jgi:DNA-binding LytR/AlgR family response regulator
MNTPPASAPSALIADDEPLLRERLAALLACLWPELRVAAQARHGREALELFDAHGPDVVFLDVHMPGLNGIEAARALQALAEPPLIVFVTAYEQYAVQAFERGALDYLVKPFDEERLAQTVQRLQGRLRERQERDVSQALDSGPASATAEEVLERLAAELARRAPAATHLQWIRASSGNTVRLIAADEVVFLKSDEKYTLVVTAQGEAVIRKTIRELADELDPAKFAQVHRSVIVNLHHVAQVVRGANETAEIHLRGHPERLPVSRSWLHVFKQM